MISTAPVLAQPNIDNKNRGKPLCHSHRCINNRSRSCSITERSDNEHSIYIALKVLSKAERSYRVTDLEALVLVFAVRKFLIFICGIPTIVYQAQTALFRKKCIGKCP